MKKYVVTAVKASFHPGTRLVLTPVQAKSRKHNLSFIGDNEWEVIATVEFKYGEELGVGGAINKALLAEISSAESPAAQETKKEVGAKKSPPPAPKNDKGTNAGFSSKAAEKLARDNGISLGDIKVKGKKGATVKDVESALKERDAYGGFLDDLEEALNGLNAEDDAHWTEEGLPDLTVLTERVGKKVGREDVAAICADGFPRPMPAGTGGDQGNLPVA